MPPVVIKRLDCDGAGAPAVVGSGAAGVAKVGGANCREFSFIDQSKNPPVVTKRMDCN